MLESFMALMIAGMPNYDFDSRWAVLPKLAASPNKYNIIIRAWQLCSLVGMLVVLECGIPHNGAYAMQSKLKCLKESSKTHEWPWL
jgi:hypothetical protein